MNVLEKILKEIEEVTFKEDAPIYVGDMEVDGYVRESVVKEIIRSYIDDVPECSDCSRRKWYQEGYKDGKDTNVHANDGWIPVSERLPDIRNKILYDMNLVTLEDGEVCLGVYHDQEHEWWTRRQQGEGRYTNKRDVIAWRPLPTPYKGELNPEDIPHACDTCRRYGKSDHNCYYCRFKPRRDLWEPKEG